MKTTNEKPTATGWYWMKGDKMPWKPVFVADSQMFDNGQGYLMSILKPDIQWSVGPIEEPDET